MAEILGLGMTHSPPLMSAQGDTAARLRRMMSDPLLPPHYRDPQHWPEPMRREWGNDEGGAHVQRHRAELIDAMRWARKELDAFRPDLVIVFGDDQYENFREDGVPAFQINCFDAFTAKPWATKPPGYHNAWDEAPDTEFRYNANKRAAKELAARLIGEGFEVAYAYEPRHDEMPHAILNTLVFLDWDRRGFDYPVVPFLTNCYGRQLIPLKGGGVNDLAKIPSGDDLDPPGPAAWRCFDLGRALARILEASRWRTALISSASWSHSFLTGKTSYFHPDVETDRRYFAALQAGDYALWRNTSLADIEAHGHQEMLNWIFVLGAMAELGNRKPQEAFFVESWLTNATKAFAVFRP
ncbi:MAG: extradiol ring-cleavage dioxygenase [Alphaproteobacteria bacterium]|nr:extradiol ring-cleavage dioxygenase [Alphaproteobacteria bacterium]